jgi:hypothetical protein
MNRTKTLMAAVGLLLPAMMACVPSAAQSATQCVALPDGIEYRAYLPDNKRFVYVAVKVIPFVFPSVFVIVDKNYDAGSVKIADGDPLNRWWVDRSRPMTFSTDKLHITWNESGTFSFATDWLSPPDPTEVWKTIRGLEPAGAGRFRGNGAFDSNTFAFQSSAEMLHIAADEFEVTVPAVSFDGVTVTPPVTHFMRDDNTVTAKC